MKATIALRRVGCALFFTRHQHTGLTNSNCITWLTCYCSYLLQKRCNSGKLLGAQGTQFPVPFLAYYSCPEKQKWWVVGRTGL